MISLATKRAALKALEHADGHISPAEVVAAAQAEDHPLHDSFDWVDAVAAQKHRLMQAQSLIRAIRLNVIVNETPLTVPAYLRDLRAETQGYRAVGDIRSEEDIARATVIDAMQRASNAIRRAQTMAALFGIDDLVLAAQSLVQEIVVRARTVDDQPAGIA